jgi:hypothetical protein
MTRFGYKKPGAVARLLATALAVAAMIGPVAGRGQGKGHQA